MMSSGQAEEMNSNHLLVSPTSIAFSQNEQQIYRVDKLTSSERHSRHSKDTSLPNSSMAATTISPTVHSHNHYFGENYYDSPSIAMIDSINNSHCYTSYQNQHIPHTAQEHVGYNDDLGERNTFQHNSYDTSTNENYDPGHPIHISSMPSASDMPSFAEDSLSSSSVAVYHFNNTLIDFTNPSDIFQFDRVHSNSNDNQEQKNTSMFVYPQQQQPSPSSNQDFAVQNDVSQHEYTASNSEQLVSADSNSFLLREYSQDYSQVRMIHQSHGFESSNNIVAEAMGNHNSYLTSCQSNNDIPEPSDHCLLPNFPSYFANREDKSPRHINHKTKNQPGNTINASSNESRHSQSGHKLHQSPVYRHNV